MVKLNEENLKNKNIKQVETSDLNLQHVTLYSGWNTSPWSLLKIHESKVSAEMGVVSLTGNLGEGL